MLRGAVLGVLACLSLPAALTAHPFDASYYSARAGVEAGPEGVRVVAAVEVPTAFVLEEFLTLYGDPSQLDEEASEIYRQRQFETLADGLRLRSNGQTVAGDWRPVDTEANGRGTDEFFLYLLEFLPRDPAVWQQDRLELRIDLEVFPRDFIYLSASTEITPPWTLVENSAEAILARSGDDLFDPATGRWTVDPRLRRLKFVLERTDSGAEP